MEILTLSQMILRFLAACGLGALMGIEREVMHKDAGIKTSMLVAGGASLFTLGSLVIPQSLGLSQEATLALFINNAGVFHMLGNVAIGIGFIGAGIIVKNQHHVQGLTTAAIIWTTASVGMLAGLGEMQFAAFAAAAISFLVFFLRKTGISRHTPDAAESNGA